MDCLSPDGVMKLSKDIVSYWAERGLTVRCRAFKIIEDEDGKVLPSNMWGMRTNLRFDKNGRAYTVEEF